MRLLAVLALIESIFAFLVFVSIILNNINNSYREQSSAWIIALAFVIQGILSYGLLKAIADITENMIEVGDYIRNLKQ